MRSRLVAVVGSGGTLDPKVEAMAEELGAALVKEGIGVVSGGLGGVMEAVSRGASKQRGDTPYPPIIGILPTYDAKTGNDYLDVVVPTGMNHMRNVLVAAAGEVVVCVGGRTGALSEVAVARKIGRPVIALLDSGGTADLVAKAIKSVIEVKSVQDAVTMIKEFLA